MFTTLTNLVTKTVTVNSANTLLTPADRIGSAVVARTPMAGHMSQGQQLLPRLSHPDSKPGGSAAGARCPDSRAGYPWPLFTPDRLDRDCQSRDWSNANEANSRLARKRATRERMTEATRTAG